MSQTAPLVDQSEFWNGDVGRKWADNQDGMDRAFAQLTERLLAAAAPSPGERVIDVGCGAGELSLMAAHRVGTAARVLGVDISRPMLERARMRDEGDRQPDRGAIEWREADASVFAFPEGAFDAIVSRFGVMFFADPVAAFANLRTALRPGGRLTMLCWRPMPENEWVAVPRAVILTVVPPPAPMPPDVPGPFAFADAARVGAILAGAGFAEIRSVAVNADLEVPSEPEQRLRYAMELGPASALLRDVDEVTRGRAADALRARLSERPATGAACWVFTARNPG